MELVNLKAKSKENIPIKPKSKKEQTEQNKA